MRQRTHSFCTTFRWFDFEKDIVELMDQLEKAKDTHEKGKLDMTDTVSTLESKVEETKKAIYTNLSGWQKVQISRHPDRPYTLDYIENIVVYIPDINYQINKGQETLITNRKIDGTF